MEKTDIIEFYTDIVLHDKDGNVIEITVPEPEYMSEIFGRS